MSTPEYETLDTETVYSGSFIEVRVDRVRLPSGEIAHREVVEHPGAVGVVVVHEGRLLMVEQMRHAAGRSLVEIPAGKLDVEGETPDECAMRELREETGWTCDRLLPLVTFLNSPGFSSETFYLFEAVGARQVEEAPAMDGGDPIRIHWMSIDDVLGKALRGEVIDAKTLIAVLVCKLRLGEEGRTAPG